LKIFLQIQEVRILKLFLGYYGSMKKELLTLYHNGFTIYAKKNTGNKK